MASFQKTLAAVVASIALGGLGTYFVTDSGTFNDYTGASAQSGVAQPKTVEYTLIAEETTLEIAPGVRVEAWTYNGTIPGPVLRATEGDRVILHFINETPMPHTIHLHGDHEEEDDGVFQIVAPGKEYTYDFIAGPPGALMYHCHVMPVTQHLRMGLYGAMIVDPKEGLEPAREYVLVAGDYDTKDQLTNNPQYIFFNGYADQYWENPLPVRTDETVRVYYMNMGAGPAYGFHIHGTIFDAYTSGIWGNEPEKVQTWEVAAGNAAIFEAKWPWEGRYLFHIHGLPEERGTMGYFDVTDAPEDAVDGVDVARTKSIDMIGWQEDLLKNLQKQDPAAEPSVEAAAAPVHTMEMQSAPEEHGTVTIPEGAATDKTVTFLPAETEIGAGETMTWVNGDSMPHTVDSKEEGLFSSGILAQKQTFEHTFSEPGTYDYYCMLHPWMTGTISVR